MPSTIYLMLRSAHKARLEARTTSMQALVRYVQQFFRTPFRGNDLKPTVISKSIFVILSLRVGLTKLRSDPALDRTAMSTPENRRGTGC